MLTTIVIFGFFVSANEGNVPRVKSSACGITVSGINAVKTEAQSSAHWPRLASDRIESIVRIWSELDAEVTRTYYFLILENTSGRSSIESQIQHSLKEINRGKSELMLVLPEQIRQVGNEILYSVTGFPYRIGSFLQTLPISNGTVPGIINVSKTELQMSKRSEGDRNASSGWIVVPSSVRSDAKEVRQKLAVQSTEVSSLIEKILEASVQDGSSDAKAYSPTALNSLKKMSEASSKRLEKIESRAEFKTLVGPEEAMRVLNSNIFSYAISDTNGAPDTEIVGAIQSLFAGGHIKQMVVRTNMDSVNRARGPWPPDFYFEIYIPKPLPRLIRLYYQIADD